MSPAYAGADPMKRKKEAIRIMGSLIASDDLYWRLNNGEKIECENCHKGYYVKFNPKAKINHCFSCNNCGETITFEPYVEVK